MEYEVVNKPVNGHGGARKGAGRKKADYVPPPEKVEFDEWRARNERAKALAGELELKIKAGEYVERASVIQACATAYASVAQTIRSIPDQLERKLGIAPELAEEIGRQLDEALGTLATEFEMMGGGSID